MIPSSPEAVQLFHEGTIALASMEANGMRVDIDYVDKAIRRATKKIDGLTEQLRADVVYKKWRRKYGANTNLDSDIQLADILFNELGYECKEKTDKGNLSAKESNLIDIDLEFVDNYRIRSKLMKARDTFLAGIKQFTTWDDAAKIWILHGTFNLNIASSYRSSSSDPNLQNFPVRFEETAKLIRQAIIPRKRFRIVEGDFSGIEVGGACCYTHDPRLIYDYTEGDMHGDMARECFKLGKKDFTDKNHPDSKKSRYVAKNQFVFPEFYGSYYVDCAKNMWDSINRMSLQTERGVPLKEHLKEHGIKRLGACDPDLTAKKGTFERHLKDIEDDFWNKRYPVYTKWKKTTWEEYKQKGYCELLTGFVCSRDSDGMPMNRKQVINYQIQGAAFHCLLWVLIQMDKWLRKNKMRSMIISQIHDSLIADVHEDEFDDYIAKITELMTVDLPRIWKWICVPLEVEIEATELNGNWFKKEKVIAA